MITIKKNTPCVVMSVLNSDMVSISFESDTTKALTFCVNKLGLYSLCADKWEDKVGIITYGNTSYATYGSSGSSYLKIVVKKLSVVKGKSKTLSGKKIVE
jgi:hypothetical protein